MPLPPRLPKGAKLPCSGATFVVHTRPLEELEPPRGVDLVVLGHRVGPGLQGWVRQCLHTDVRVIAVRGTQPSDDFVLQRMEEEWEADTYLMTRPGEAPSLTAIVDHRLLHTLSQQFGGSGRSMMVVIPPTTDALLALLRAEGIVYAGMLDDASIVYHQRDQWDSITPLGEIIDYALRAWRADLKAYSAVVSALAGLRDKLGDRAFERRVFERLREVWAVSLIGEPGKARADLKRRGDYYMSIVLPACEVLVDTAHRDGNLLIVDATRAQVYDIDEIAAIALFDEEAEGTQVCRVAVRWMPSPKGTRAAVSQITLVSRAGMPDLREAFGVDAGMLERFTFPASLLEGPNKAELMRLLTAD